MEVEPAEGDRVFESGEPEATRLVRELQSQIEHLVRSNKEMEEFMSENGQQKELRDAIGENIVIIARRRAILEDLIEQAGGAPARASSMLTDSARVANDTETTTPERDGSISIPMNTTVEGELAPADGVFL